MAKLPYAKESFLLQNVLQNLELLVSLVMNLLSHITKSKKHIFNIVCTYLHFKQ